MKNTIPGMCKDFLTRASHSKSVFVAAAVVGLAGTALLFVPVFLLEAVRLLKDDS